MNSPTAVIAYLTLFSSVGILFLLITLFLGRFFRPHAPSTEKQETYECGEPPVGSSYVQFDLRFYVVALLFIVFEVEIALFFPPAVVFGNLRATLAPQFGSQVEQSVLGAAPQIQPTPALSAKLQELGVEPERALAVKTMGAGEEINSVIERENASVKDDLQKLFLMALIDLGLFFVILLVGFAYVWYRGDLDWVRAFSQEPPVNETPETPQLVLRVE